MEKTKAKDWISAFRLRTLPLSLSSIFLGSFLAAYLDNFRWEVFVLASVTTLFLQILSNLANDYGDAVNGVDNENRIGPERAIQSGAISKASMKKAILIFVLLSLSSGIWLVFEGTKGLTMNYSFFFIVLGIGAIIAAMKYTIGKVPYGYRGFGDIFVFLFFGLTGVLGTFFLHTQHIASYSLLLPAASIGFLSAGVLNLNNMRDRIEDEKVGKITLAVRLGKKHSKTYHIALILAAILSSLIFTTANYISPLQFIFILSFPLLFINIKAVASNTNPALLDVQLKKLAITTLFFSLSFGLGLVIS